MNLDVLKYFKYIALYKNITKAANYFYISQSTLSRQIMALEEELGVKLIERNNRITSLTPAGKILYDEIDLLIQHIENIKKKVQAANTGEIGSLHLLSIGNLQNTINSHIIDYIAQYPNVDFTIQYYDFTTMIEAIKFHLFDAAFTLDFSLTQQDMEDLKTINIAPEYFDIAVPKSIHTKDDFIENIKSNSSLQLILPTHIDPPCIGQWINYIKSLTNKDLVIVNYLNSTESTLLQVRTGLGYTIVPHQITVNNHNMENIQLIPLSEFIKIDEKYNIVLLYNKSNKNPSFFNFLKTFD